MARNSDHKPLARYPSAMAQDTAPLRMPRRFGFLRWLVRSLILLIMVAGIGITGLYFYLSSGPVSNEQLRQQIVTTLTSLLGPSFEVAISEAHVSIGNGGVLSVGADRVNISRKSTGVRLGNAGRVQIGLKILPLLKGSYQVQSIHLHDASVDVTPLLVEDDRQTSAWPDALHIEKMMKLPAEQLQRISGELARAGLEKVIWKNLRIHGFDLYSDRQKDLVVTKVSVGREENSGNLVIEASASIDGRTVHLKGDWLADNDGYALRLKVDGLDAGDLLPSATNRSEGLIGLSAPVKIDYFHSYDLQLEPRQSTARIDLGKGLLRFDRAHMASLSNGQLNLRLIPEKNQIELEKSPVRFGETEAELTGGIRFPLPKANKIAALASSGSKLKDNNAAVLQSPIFELIANKIVAKPSDSSEQPVAASLKFAGEINAEEKLIELHEIRLWSAGGDLQGAGSMGFGGETPSLALALRIPTISVTALKQLWPIFIAAEARRWVLDNMSGGKITNARIDAAVPPGIFQRANEGKKFAPEHLHIQLDVAETSIKLPDELPTISRARGKVVVQGMETDIVLESGRIDLANGRSVEVSNGEMKIGDFEAIPTLSRVTVDLKGNASDVLWIGGQKPLRVVEVVKINPEDISGKAQVRVNAGFPLQAAYLQNHVDWSAEIKLRGASLKRPLEGRRVSNADVTIKAQPGILNVAGEVNLDGIPSKISLHEPFGSNSKGRAVHDVKLVLNAAARKKLGVDLDGILDGVVTASVKNTEDATTKKVVVNLRHATLRLPWVSWSKGKGISATAEFKINDRGDQTIVRDFQLRGAGFRIDGDLVLDKAGLRRAKFTNIILNKGDNLSVKVQRAKGGYQINANGKAYDARGIINQVLNQGTPNSKVTRSAPIYLDAKIDKVTGFGGEIISAVTLRLNQKNGRLGSARLKGLARRTSKTAFTIKSEKGSTVTTLTSGDAGAALRFLDIYPRMLGGALSAKLRQKGRGPHVGKVAVRKFHLRGEPRLKRLLSKNASKGEGRGSVKSPGGKMPKTNPDDLKVSIASGEIVKDDKSLTIRNGVLVAGDVGSSFSGNIYDAAGNMNLKGTYLPGYGLNRIASKIPIVNLAFGNGTKRGFMGITYRLRGKSKNPKISVNPISVIAPGIFRKVFEFK